MTLTTRFSSSDHTTTEARKADGDAPTRDEKGAILAGALIKHDPFDAVEILVLAMQTIANTESRKFSGREKMLFNAITEFLATKEGVDG